MKREKIVRLVKKEERETPAIKVESLTDYRVEVELPVVMCEDVERFERPRIEDYLIEVDGSLHKVTGLCISIGERAIMTFLSADIGTGVRARLGRWIERQKRRNP